MRDVYIVGGYLLELLLKPALLLPIFLLVWLLYARKLKRQGVTVPVAHTVWLCVFCVYIIYVLNVTGALSLFDLLLRGPMFTPESINLVPFHDTTRWGFSMNVLMMAPLGFFMPLLFHGYERFPKTLLAGFFTSLAIEIGQLFNWRATDVDDLIANVLGAAIGWLVFRLLVRRPRPKLQLSGGHPFIKHEGAAAVVAVFVLVFLFQPLYVQLMVAIYG